MSTSNLLAAPPWTTGVLVANHPSDTWRGWLLSLWQAVTQATTTIGDLSLTAQAASIATSTLKTTTRTAGAYRVNYYTRITQAASVSSSLQVTIGWTDGGQSCSQSGSALTGNTVTTTESGTVYLHADAGSTVTYRTAYSSTGGTARQYRVDATVQRVP